MERLYNNIQLPDVWPPKNKETTLDQPLEVPYLSQKPDTIDIRVGRQLFVDDFLIAETDLVRVEGKPETHAPAAFAAGDRDGTEQRVLHLRLSLQRRCLL